MPSISHLRKLKPSKVLELLQDTQSEWLVSVKDDGSFLGFGLDEEGKFFTQRKNAPRIYSIEDWGNECWSSIFKSAHSTCNVLMDELLVRNLISFPVEISSELIHRTSSYYATTNVIPYSLRTFDEIIPEALIRINNHSHLSHDCLNFIKSFRYYAKSLERNSPNGIDVIDNNVERHWTFDVSTIKTLTFPFAHTTEDFHKKLNEIDIYGFRVIEILEMPLNTRHPSITPSEWKTVKTELKTRREKLRLNYEAMIDFIGNQFVTKYGALNDNYIGFVRGAEGIVVTTPSVTFKVISCPWFGYINQHIHLVKYWLVGGRRPARPSFLSRTKDWSVERRLKRLDVLLDRYLKYRSKLVVKVPEKRAAPPWPLKSWDYTGDLHQRTLNLFCDVRSRIQNGR